MNILNYEFIYSGIPLCHLIIDIMCEKIRGKTYNSSIKEFITLFYYFIVTKCKWEANHILCSVILLLPLHNQIKVTNIKALIIFPPVWYKLIIGQ